MIVWQVCKIFHVERVNVRVASVQDIPKCHVERVRSKRYECTAIAGSQAARCEMAHHIWLWPSYSLVKIERILRSYECGRITDAPLLEVGTVARQAENRRQEYE